MLHVRTPVWMYVKSLYICESRDADAAAATATADADSAATVKFHSNAFHVCFRTVNKRMGSDPAIASRRLPTTQHSQLTIAI